MSAMAQNGKPRPGDHDLAGVEATDYAGAGAGSTNGIANGNGNGNTSASPYLATAFASPHSLRDALRANGKTELDGNGSGTTSEEDYDDIASPPIAVLVPRKPASTTSSSTTTSTTSSNASGPSRRHLLRSETSSSTLSADELSPLKLTTVATTTKRKTNGIVISPNDAAVHDVVRRSLQHARDSSSQGGRAGVRRGKFSDLVFTRKFSTFDRQNLDAANSPFHGFFTLFWMGMFLFMVKIAADNWKKHGSPLGTNEIMKTMFRRDVLVMLAADGVMCGITGVSWLLQRAIRAGYVDWDRTGWILQNIWQTIFFAGVVGITLLRDWPWTHTVFFVMHGMVMLMKQHSYAFYNGYLSSAYKKRAHLLSTLKQLEHVDPVRSPSQTEPPVSAISTDHLAHIPSAHEYKERRQSISHEKDDDISRIAAAISSGEPLDEEQVQVFERILKWEVDALSSELRGKATTADGAYPNKLTYLNHYEFIVLPTLVYELEYPRSNSINWYYAAEKMAACFGVIFVMIMISQAFIYPVVVETVRLKEAGVPLAERFQQFPWMMSDLIFPFMMEYLLVWYLIWETILNFLAELTYFADRSFYDAWWNCVSWDQFARDWNRPVHNFLLRHVYHSSISAMKLNKHTATLVTFFLSACVHELVMWCIFKKLRGYLLVLQMCQLPLVRLSRTKWLRNKQTLGNMIFWLGIFTGPSMLCSLYLIL